MADKPTDNRLLRLRKHGMFSNVNEVVEQLRLAEEGGYRFHIEWSQSCYRDPERPGDPWTYFFEPCFPITPQNITELPVVRGGVQVACTVDNVITPRKKDGVCNPLLLPRDRHAAHRLIRTYLKLKPEVNDRIRAFISAHFRERMIGAHIRGPGRLDGGSGDMRRIVNPDGGVPFELYFQAIDEAIETYPDAGLLVCSDSSAVIAKAREVYGDRVVTHNAVRSEFGEMHANHQMNQGMEFPKYQLGLDVLVEAHLLAECSYLVHGNSNVANYVLCASPDLAHHYVPA